MTARRATVTRGPAPSRRAEKADPGLPDRSGRGAYGWGVNVRFLRLALIGAVVAAGWPTVAAAQSATPGSWRIVTVLRHCDARDSLLSVTATGPRNAWALGQPNGGDRGCNADLEHWNGARWRRVIVPRAITLGNFLTLGEFSYPLAASSATDAWIFPVRNLLNGSSYALRWDGRTWRQSGFPVRLTVASAAAFGPWDAWAFGWLYKNGPAAPGHVPAAARWDGRAWHLVAIPGMPQVVSAPSRHDLWAVGPSAATAGKASGRQKIIAMRWTGRTWHVTAVPKIAVRRGQSYSTADATAAGLRDLWWCYQVFGRAGDLHIGLLHWDGSGWHHVPVPAGIISEYAMTGDGHAGLWLLVGTGLHNQAEYWYHYAGGEWTRQLVPSPRGTSSMLFGMARVPGTTSAWAVGEADSNHGSVAVIAKYDP